MSDKEITVKTRVVGRQQKAKHYIKWRCQQCKAEIGWFGRLLFPLFHKCDDDGQPNTPQSSTPEPPELRGMKR